ncbi:uncharacterized protein ARMOST_14787 [Armillaria ostoyae]|uniref:Uncharacterized protein n=1 Tax=Armillaria ostoyae TaxID=47428 RepID=A0A284RRK8_ARMOS|nr:uncharacterized protein ARMOST_14787 [Armillaria ostoyae]
MYRRPASKEDERSTGVRSERGAGDVAAAGAIQVHAVNFQFHSGMVPISRTKCENRDFNEEIWTWSRFERFEQ